MRRTQTWCALQSIPCTPSTPSHMAELAAASCTEEPPTTTSNQHHILHYHCVWCFFFCSLLLRRTISHEIALRITDRDSSSALSTLNRPLITSSGIIKQPLLCQSVAQYSGLCS